VAADPWLLPEDIRLGSLDSKFVDCLRSLGDWLAVLGTSLIVDAAEFVELAVWVLVYGLCTRFDP